MMEILSWNIMSGGFDTYGSNSARPERMDGIVKTIKRMNPDFVSLVDTHRWKEVFSATDLREHFGYEHVFMVNLKDKRLIKLGHDNGITVLTRLPVVKTETIRLYNRNAIKTTVDSRGDEVDIFSVYLDDLKEKTRLKQIEALFEAAQPGRPTILIGDLNTVDKGDLTVVRKVLKELFIRLPLLENRLGKVAAEMMRAEVTREIKRRDFNDFGEGKGDTFPSQLSPIPVDRPIARIDYAFGRGITTEEFKVLKDGELNKLSDHFPILVRTS